MKSEFEKNLTVLGLVVASILLTAFAVFGEDAEAPTQKKAIAEIATLDGNRITDPILLKKLALTAADYPEIASAEVFDTITDTFTTVFDHDREFRAATRIVTPKKFKPYLVGKDPESRQYPYVSLARGEAEAQVMIEDTIVASWKRALNDLARQGAIETPAAIGKLTMNTAPFEDKALLLIAPMVFEELGNVEFVDSTLVEVRCGWQMSDRMIRASTRACVGLHVTDVMKIEEACDRSPGDPRFESVLVKERSILESWRKAADELRRVVQVDVPVPPTHVHH